MSIKQAPSPATKLSSQDVAQSASSPPQPNKPAPVHSAEQLQWSELAYVSKYVAQRNWAQAPIPVELAREPDGLTIPEKLRQILIWSTWRIEDFPQLKLPTAPTDVHSDEPVGDENANSLPSPTATNNAVSATDLRRALSVREVRPGVGPEVESLKSRLKQLRQTVLAPIAPTSARESLPKIETPPPPTTGECISCFDEFPKAQLVRLKCLHEYCRPCLKEVVFNAMKTESAFPPKCCLSEISLPTILQCLDAEERKEYKDKAAEYSIGAAQRWYCPNTACTKWIRPEKLHRNRKEHQTCPHCKVKICSTCRAEAHDGNQDCPQDFGLEATLEIAEYEGWRRCYSCRTMVELTTGCRHITCKCGAQFCYVCCAVWRTCGCTEEDKVRRMQELRQKRDQRDREQEEADAAALAEEEEIAQAIAQVEEMERREAEERAAEEQRRQEEEEQLLATLESLRLQEEQEKKEALERAEREYREVLRTSCLDECQIIREVLQSIIQLQQADLTSQHTSREQTTLSESSDRERNLVERINKVGNDMERIIYKRKKRFVQKQQAESAALAAQFEEEEDNLFIQLQIHLRDKPNREAREARMRAAFQESHQIQFQKLGEEQRKANKKLEVATDCDRQGILKWADNLWGNLKVTDTVNLQRLGTQVGADRRWFELVTQRRLKMIDENEKLMLHQLDNEEEVIGLTLEKARDIEPLLPNVEDGCPGSSSTKRDSDTHQVKPIVSPLEGRSYVSTPVPPEDPDMYGPVTYARQTPRSVPVELPAHLSVPNSSSLAPPRLPLTPPGSTTPPSTDDSRSLMSNVQPEIRSLPGSFPLSPCNSVDQKPNSATENPSQSAIKTTSPTIAVTQPRFYADRNNSYEADGIPATPPRSINPSSTQYRVDHGRHSSEFSGVSSISMSGALAASYFRSGPVSPISNRNSLAQTLSPVSSVDGNSTPPRSGRTLYNSFRTSVSGVDTKRPSVSSSEASHSSQGKKSTFGSLLSRKKVPLTEEEIKERMRALTVGDAR